MKFDQEHFKKLLSDYGTAQFETGVLKGDDPEMDPALDRCLAAHSALLEYAASVLAVPEGARTDETAASLLRQFVSITKHMKDAVWYDKDENRHPAVTPLYEALAEEVNAYLPQSHETSEKP